MRVAYFADDGREFDNEEECEQYEYALSMEGKFPTTRFFNRVGKSVPFLASCEFCENLFYVDVSNMDEALLLHQWFQDCGFDSIWPRDFHRGVTITLGRFFYDTEEDRWRNIEELYKAYQDVLDVFEPMGE